MTPRLAQVDWSLLPVQQYHACAPDRECPHCKAGRPAAPAEAGEPTQEDAVTSEIDQAMRYALPPAFHIPRFLDLIRPALWVCAACWDDDGDLTSWPCTVASAHGRYVDRAMHLSEQTRTA